jgi:hypothetical protein
MYDSDTQREPVEVGERGRQIGDAAISGAILPSLAGLDLAGRPATAYPSTWPPGM